MQVEELLSCPGSHKQTLKIPCRLQLWDTFQLKEKKDNKLKHWATEKQYVERVIVSQPTKHYSP